MRIFLSISLLLLVACATAESQEFLYPEEGLWSSYSPEARLILDVRDSLFKGWSYSYYARVVYLGMTSEWALSIDRVWRNDYAFVADQYIRVCRFETPIGMFSMERQDWKRKRLQSSRFQRYEKRIPYELCLEVYSIFNYMLDQTSYPKQPHVSIDGADYYFLAPRNLQKDQFLGIRSGWIYSPDEGSKTDRLTKLAHKLYLYATSNAKEEKQILGEIEAMVDEFPGDKTK